MKKTVVILFFAFLCFFCSCLLQKNSKQALYDLQEKTGEFSKIDSIQIMPANTNIEGNADSGFKYMVNGDLFNSGIPYSLYKFLFKITDRKILSLAGYNRYELNDFGKFDGQKTVVAPGCLHCHAQVFNDDLIIGLGNSYSKFQVNYHKYLKPGKFIFQLLYGKRSQHWKNFETLYNTSLTVSPNVVLEMQGPNPAHRIGNILASHRDPVTFEFRSDTTYFLVPPAAVPTDIPALWLSKKKNAWTSSALANGSPAKQFMLSTLLTIKDTTEAAAVYQKMLDVWAYLKTLTPPNYPSSVNTVLAEKGERIFNANCSSCHGTYGENGSYPNKLVPEWIVGTDSLLLKYYLLYPGYANWYNKSWFATSYQPAFAQLYYGYIAPPLDGVWITAPYFHNGSVPTLEAVLNSKLRPQYWKRNLNKQEYDYNNLGWKYKTLRKPGNKKTYNTDIPGYGNYGHYFGDKLTDDERKAVLEYLKTL